MNRRRFAGDAGMVTAEMAAGLPVLMFLLAAAVAAVSVVGTGIRLQDAAREAARAVARGDPAVGRQLAQAQAPGSTLVVATTGPYAVATVRTTVRPLGGWLPAVTVTERAVAAVESPAATP